MSPNSKPNESSFNWGAVKNGLGAAGKGMQAYGGISSGNYVYGGLNAAATIPYFANQFPQTFDPNSYQDPSSKALVNGLNTAGKYAGPGLDGYNLYGNVQAGNYPEAFGNAQSLTAFGQNNGYIPDFTNQIQNSTGLKPVSYGEGADATVGYAPYVGAGLGTYGAIKGIQQGDYFGAGMNAVSAGQDMAAIYSSYFPAAAELGTQAAATGTSSAVAAGSQAGATAGSQAAGTGAAAGTGSTMGSVATGLGYAAAAYGAYNLVKMGLDGGDTHKSDTGRSAATGAASGAAIGTAVLPGVGTAIGALAGAAYGTVVAQTGSGKGKRQVIRDSYRESIGKSPDIKLFDENYKGTLADGTEVDFGKDKYSFNESDASEGNIDLTSKEGQDAAAFGDVIAAAQGLKGEGRESIATMFASAALKNSKGKPEVAAANMNHFLGQMGLDKGTTQQLLNQNVVEGKIGKEDYAAFSATLNRLGKAGGNSEARQLSPEEIDQVSGKKGSKIVGTDPKTGAPATDLPIDFADTDGRPDTGKRLPTPAEKEFKSTKGPHFSDALAENEHGGPGKPGIAKDGVNKTMTYPDGTVMTTLIGVVKPADKVNQNLAAGKPPSTNLSADDIRKLYTDAAKSGIAFRRT